MLRVDIWSDIVCPFCYIGKRRFQRALDDFAHRDEVEVVWRSFELAPGVHPDKNTSLQELLAKKYGRSMEWAQQMNEYMAGQAAELGLTMDFGKAVPTNSFDAHRLYHYAREQGCGDAVLEKLFLAYYSEGRDLEDEDTLVEIAESGGLDREGAREVLASERYTEEVRADENEAYQFNITGVPAFVFNRKHLISGAQPTEAFAEALEQLWSEEGAGLQEG